MLTEAQRGAVTALRDAPQAWARWDELDGGTGVLDGLKALGLVEPWDRPDGRMVTFSPYGAWLAGVVTDEVWRSQPETRDEHDPHRPLAVRQVTERVAVEVPRWRESGRDDRGDPTLPATPIVLPRHARLGVGLVAPDRIPAPDDDEGPEFLRDEDGVPVTLFGGHPVLIDGRLRRGA